MLSTFYYETGSLTLPRSLQVGSTGWPVSYRDLHISAYQALVLHVCAIMLGLCGVSCILGKQSPCGASSSIPVSTVTENETRAEVTEPVRHLQIEDWRLEKERAEVL